MINKCLFPVAGYGTRFLPATKAVPKEMLPIVDRPLVQYGVQEAMDAGISSMAFVTGREKGDIEDHFDISFEIESAIKGTAKEDNLQSVRAIMDQCTFGFIRQREMNGLGHAILTGEPMIGNEAFGVILVDDLCITESKTVMQQMTDLFEQHQCSIVAIEEVPQQDTSMYGVISGEQISDRAWRVDNMVEKPDPSDAPSNMAIIGRYLLTPDIFDIIRSTPPGKGGEIQITDAILEQAKQGRVLAYQFEGRRFDCGSIGGYIEATNYVYENIYKPAHE